MFSLSFSSRYFLISPVTFHVFHLFIYASLRIGFIAVTSSLLILSSAMANLLLIPSSEFFFSGNSIWFSLYTGVGKSRFPVPTQINTIISRYDNKLFHVLSVVTYFFAHSCVSIFFLTVLNFFISLSKLTFIKAVVMSLSANSIISYLDQFLLVNFSFSYVSFSYFVYL